jgi:beta-N-acetylhexosaminidase
MAIDDALRRLALGTLLAAFPGPAAPDWALDLLRDGLAGHTLFGTNVTDAEQVAALTAQLRAARPDALVAIDEEGGDVTRLGHRTGSPYPGNAALGVVDDTELTHTVYAAIGADLVAAGINLDLAPTVDVNTADDNPIIGTRSFGADPALVSRHAAAAVAGLQSAGVAACAKHFPGHGATVADSHLELPTVDAPLDVLRSRDLPPFAAVVAAGTRSIMTAHIRVPALTGDAPATFSRAALADLLRGEYGYQGVIITDALEMKGAAEAAGGIPRAAVAALAAGADLLCIGADVGHSLVEDVVAEIIAAVGDGRLPLERLQDACSRTADMAAWAAAPPPPPPVAPARGHAPPPPPRPHPPVWSRRWASPPPAAPSVSKARSPPSPTPSSSSSSPAIRSPKARCPGASPLTWTAPSTSRSSPPTRPRPTSPPEPAPARSSSSAGTPTVSRPAAR